MSDSKALDILEEFVLDVNMVGPETVAVDWPDLYITYERANEVLATIPKQRYEIVDET